MPSKMWSARSMSIPNLTLHSKWTWSALDAMAQRDANEMVTAVMKEVHADASAVQDG